MIFAKTDIFNMLDANGLYVLLVVGSILFVGLIGKRTGWFKLVSGTNALLKEQNAELRIQNNDFRQAIADKDAQHTKDVADWQARYTESIKQIANLQGKIETLATIPVQSIDRSLEKLVKISEANAVSNELILKQLQSSAGIHIAEQKACGLKVQS